VDVKRIVLVFYEVITLTIVSDTYMFVDIIVCPYLTYEIEP